MPSARIGSSPWTIGPQSLGPGMSAAVEHRDDAGQRAQAPRRRSTTSRPCATGDRPSAACSVPAELGDVVDVGGLAGHVQVRRFVRRG